MRAPLAFARTFWDKSFARTRPVLSWVKSKQLLPANAKCDNWIEKSFNLTFHLGALQQNRYVLVGSSPSRIRHINSKWKDCAL